MFERQSSRKWSIDFSTHLYQPTITEIESAFEAIDSGGHCAQPEFVGQFAENGDW